MEVMEQGRYSGDITAISHGIMAIASLTTYDVQNHFEASHFHVNAHISLVLDGTTVEKRKVSDILDPGKLVYYSAGEPHEVTRVVEPSTHINLELEDEFFHTFNVSDSAVRTAVLNNPDAKFLMLKILRETLCADDLSIDSIQMLLMNLMFRVGGRQRNLPLWAVRVKEFIHEHWNERISLTQLSEISGVHPVTISKYFPLYFSNTFGEYIRKIKVENALRLIKSRTDSLADVAYQCGFSDQSHFIRVFRQITGYSPGSYKMTR